MNALTTASIFTSPLVATTSNPATTPSWKKTAKPADKPPPRRTLPPLRVGLNGYAVAVV